MVVTEALRSGVVPLRYLTDAEVFVRQASTDESLNGSVTAQRQVLEKVCALVQEATQSDAGSNSAMLASLQVIAGSAAGSAPTLRRRYSRKQSL